MVLSLNAINSATSLLFALICSGLPQLLAERRLGILGVYGEIVRFLSILMVSASKFKFLSPIIENSLFLLADGYVIILVSFISVPVVMNFKSSWSFLLFELPSLDLILANKLFWTANVCFFRILFSSMMSLNVFLLPVSVCLY